MDKRYELGDQVHVGSLIVYGDETDSKLYDKATGADKVQVKQAVVEQAFLSDRDQDLWRSYGSLLCSGS